MAGTARLKDVADAAGVHVATASRALNPESRHLVRVETADRILREARRMGYVPDHFARGLRTRRSYTVGVIIPDLTNPLFPPIVRGIEDVLSEVGYTALIANTDNDSVAEHLRFDAFLRRSVDGFILATARRSHEAVDVALASGYPVVLANRRTSRTDVSTVTTDDGRGTTAVIDHLVGLGHRRVAYVAGPQDLSTGFTRLEAFRSAMAAHGLDVENDQVVVCPAFSVESGARAMVDLLARDSGSTAVVAANDLLALGVLDTLRAEGRRCPEDVSVVGYNDMPFVDKLDPPLTTVRIPHYEVGATAARLLLELLAVKREARQPRSVVLPTELVVRRSSGPPRR